MEIKIEIDDNELKDYVLSCLIRKSIDNYEYSREIKRVFKPILDEISKEYRSELKEIIIERCVDKITSQDTNEVMKKAIASMLKG